MKVLNITEQEQNERRKNIAVHPAIHPPAELLLSALAGVVLLLNSSVECYEVFDFYKEITLHEIWIKKP